MIKTTYEKVTFSKMSEAFAEHEKAALYNVFKHDIYIELDDSMVFDSFNEGFTFYRKVETEITQMQVAKGGCKKCNLTN